MKIAKVIVDVPSSQTDKAYDYKIPDNYQAYLKKGMRVIVPFGMRKVQGIVVDFTNESQYKGLKNISSVVDITPVLTNELLQLGFWLTKKTLCFAISAFQVMLPAAMKAKYEKEIHIVNRENLPHEVVKYFKTNDVISWKKIENEKNVLPFIQTEIQKGNLELIYQVKDRVRKKTKRMVYPAVSKETLRKERKLLSSKAKKQQELLDYFVEHPVEIEWSTLLSTLKTTDSPLKMLINKGILKEKKVEVYRDPYQDREFKKTSPLPLTKEQKQAIKPILNKIESNQHEVFLMYGVTGSGKTEVYMQSIDAVLKKGKEAIVLVPEIALTPMMVERFKGRFGSRVAVLHSGLSTGEKYDEWRKIQRKEVRVVVGARSAIFAPFENLGIIIIDEEHETSYKQEESPRYHARDVAIFRGNHHQCPVVLGSATPTLESFARAKKGVYQLLTLEKRLNERTLPSVDIVDMREELRNQNRSMFSNLLYDKLKDRLKKNEQSVLFLNRRGFSTFVMCRNCGYTIECPHCDITLTYHKRGHLLKCHYCSYEMNMPNRCPECSSEYIRFFGTGTQKVEEELGKVLPEARVIRMDVDTTRKKGAHEKLLNAFGEGKADILLGTQMIAKGLDFPKVTLVGVLAADSMLNIPDFRSAEKTFQLLTQVSGRAGRHDLPGEVVIQTYAPSHYSIELASDHDYLRFYQKEMVLRKKYCYPPFFYLALVTVSHHDLMKVVSVTEKITAYLKQHLSKQSLILGPVASSIPRIKDRYRYQCMIKYKDEPKLVENLQYILDHYQKEMANENLQISIDMNPYLLM